nr:hypothetical protein [Glutamicibacter mysorens]
MAFQDFIRIRIAWQEFLDIFNRNLLCGSLVPRKGFAGYRRHQIGAEELIGTCATLDDAEDPHESLRDNILSIRRRSRMPERYIQCHLSVPLIQVVLGFAASVSDTTN